MVVTQTIIASIIIFGLLVFIHELGHFSVAKAVGVRVKEFALGFGPKLFSHSKGETDYSLRIFPLGGFVRLTGEDPEEADEPGSFQAQSVLSRIAVIAAGPLMNFFLAIVLFSSIYFFFLGVPQYGASQIGEVYSGDRAEAAGFEQGDIILTINNDPVASWDDTVSTISANPGEDLTVVVDRNGETHTLQVTPRLEGNRGIIGIAPVGRKFLLFSSLKMGIDSTWWFTRFTIVSLVQMVTGQIPAEVAGPVGIVRIVGEVAQTGIVNLFSLAGVLSINLGLINLLPIPALDGSRLIFLGIEGIRGKPFDQQKESFIHFIGFTMLILLMIIVFYQDIIRLEIF